MNAMSKETREWLSGRLGGKRFPVAIQTVGEIAAAFIDAVRGFIHDAERREQATHDQACAVHQRRMSNREKSTYDAIEEGKDLVKLAVLQWNGDWKRACAMSNMCERTAENLLVLLGFYYRYHDPNGNPIAGAPTDLFGVFAKLGRTKLYALARLPDEVLRTLDPEMLVDVGGKQVPLRFLSDRELLAFLRTVLPVTERKRISGLRALVTRFVLFVDNPAKIAKISVPDLTEVRTQTQEIFQKLDRALKNRS